MTKNCLASLGLIFLILLAALGATLALAFFDITGTGPSLSLPESLPEISVNGTPVISPGGASGLGPLQTVVSSPSLAGPRFELLNPLEGRTSNLSDASTPPPALPTAAPTPLPLLDPLVYRTEIELRLRHFGAALEAFMSGNDELAKDSSLISNEEWRSKMAVALDDVAASGKALGEVGPPPVEYEAINAWLQRVGPQSESLRDHYRQALEGGGAESGGPAASFTAAGDDFARIKAYLFAALDEMSKAGWPIE